MLKTGMAVVALCLAPALHADTTLRWQELNRSKGKAVRMTAVGYSSPGGLRMEATETSDDGTKTIVFLYRRADETLYMKSDGKLVALTPALVKSLRDQLKSPKPKVSVTATKTRHTFSGFPCEGHRLREAGLPDRYVCMAEPTSIKVDEITARNFRDMTRIMSDVARLSREKGGPDPDRGINVNTYDMKEGFPVREWESRKGEIWMESSLTSVSSGDQLSPSLFEPLK